jgi:uncharacterized pyridoxal phosphate-containing UPF0001 family protein
MTSSPDTADTAHTADPADAVGVAGRLAEVRSRISAAGGDLEKVRIVAVTKGLGAEAARVACSAGLLDLGENYAGELLAKAAELASPEAGSSEDRPSGAGPRWHYLGGVQRNKVARLAPHVALWQGVDRAEEGESIARHAPGAAVLVEVDTTGLAGRGGVPLDGVASLVDRLRSLDLDVRGLMTVAPPVGLDRNATARAFADVGQLVAELGLDEASMGMSDDFELAVAEGSTMVRIGRALFGPRPAAARVSQ